MPLFFKKKKAEEKAEEKVKEKAKEKAKEIKEKPSPDQKVGTKARRGVKAGEAWRILKTPHVTEKAADLAEKNQYVFKVWPGVNKTEIGKAIEDIYGVDVLSVKIIKVPRKKRRLGKVQGWRKGYKKAIIRIKEGQKIEVMPK